MLAAGKERAMNWLFSVPAKEIVRSLNIIMGGINAGLSIKYGWYVAASAWAAWSFLSCVYLIGIYIEQGAKTK